MANTPGQVVAEFTTKDGRQAVIRYPQASDLQAMTDSINELSAENTFIRFGGEQQTLEQEAKYLDGLLAEIAAGKNVSLMAFVAGEYAGMCNIKQDDTLAARRLHVGVFGIALRAAFRDAGVGRRLAECTIAEARANLNWLKILRLDCFAINKRAIHLYESLGFKLVGRLPHVIYYRGDYVDEIVMVLEFDQR